MDLAYYKCFKNNFKFINPAPIGSYIDSALGITKEDRLTFEDCNCSMQSFRICVGNRIEHTFNDIATIQGVNLLKEERVPQGFYKRNGKAFKKGDRKPDKIIKGNTVKVGKKNRQIDHFFEITLPDGSVLKLYLDSKSCVLFDTEKDPASLDKLVEVADILGADMYGYFIPFVETIPQELVVKHPKVKLFGLRDVLGMLGNPFTPEDYFSVLREMKTSAIQDIKNRYEALN